MKIKGLEHLTDFNRVLRAALERGPVLVCYLDGLGWKIYEEAVRRERMPYVRKHFFVNPMQTVFPPLTNPAMAAMLTGAEPEVHGVISRKQHRTKVPTIFAGQPEAVIVEGDSVILQTEVPQRLHTEAEDGNIDYSVFADGMQYAGKVPPLLFLHFHGIDDAGHTYGPYASETMEKIREVDGYVERLAAKWPGEIFLISDHGLHEEIKMQESIQISRGDHGQDREEDRTIIFGWKNGKEPEFPERISGEVFCRMLAWKEEVTQVLFTGADGYAVACSLKELSLQSKGTLCLNRGDTMAQDTWRLAFLSEPVARRWCKDVAEIDICG